MANPFKNVLRRLAASPAPLAGADRLRFSAEIPGLAGLALLKIALEAHTEPDSMGGERTRIRAHFQANLASVVKPALAALAARSQAAAALAALPAPASTTSLRPATGLQALAPLRARANHWLAQQSSQYLPALQQTLAPLLQHDLQTWVEVHASSAPLADGAKTLLPNAEGLKTLGIVPVENGTPLQAWSGQVGNESAAVSLLRLDDSHLPPNLKQALGGKPFNLAAAVVSVATRK